MPRAPPQPASKRFLVFSLHLPTSLLQLSKIYLSEEYATHIPASGHTILHVKTSIFLDASLNPIDFEVQMCAWPPMQSPGV